MMNKKTNMKATEAKRRKAWTDIRGTMSIFGKKVKSKKKHSFVSYFTTVGVKKDDEWENMFFNVYFPKVLDPQLEGRFTVNVRNGFLTFEEWNETQKPKVVILDYELLEFPDEEDDEEDDENHPD